MISSQLQQLHSMPLDQSLVFWGLTVSICEMGESSWACCSFPRLGKVQRNKMLRSRAVESESLQFKSPPI